MCVVIVSKNTNKKSRDKFVKSTLDDLKSISNF